MSDNTPAMPQHYMAQNKWLCLYCNDDFRTLQHMREMIIPSLQADGDAEAIEAIAQFNLRYPA